jgi:hypothetical protein
MARILQSELRSSLGNMGVGHAPTEVFEVELLAREELDPPGWEYTVVLDLDAAADLAGRLDQAGARDTSVELAGDGFLVRWR